MTKEQKKDMVFDALRWVAQEARAMKIAGVVLPHGSRLRESLDALDKAYLIPEDDD